MTSRGDVTVREIAPEIAPADESIRARFSWPSSSISPENSPSDQATIWKTWIRNTILITQSNIDINNKLRNRMLNTNCFIITLSSQSCKNKDIFQMHDSMIINQRTNQKNKKTPQCSLKSSLQQQITGRTKNGSYKAKPNSNPKI